MRRILLAVLLSVIALIPVLRLHGTPGSYAQTVGVPQGDEFNNNSFVAPFVVRCGQFATGTCPDAQGPNTWSLNGQGNAGQPGYLRIMTQFGSLVGATTQSSNNARNFVVEPSNPIVDYTVTTKLTFPGGAYTNITPLGQTAGILVYQDDDHFIYLGRVLNSNGTTQVEFVQEDGASPLVQPVTEAGFLQPTIYLRLVKTGDLYQAYYSYDNQNFVSVSPALAPTATATATSTATATATSTSTATATGTPPTATSTPTATATATSTPLPTGYLAEFATPQVGVFAWGGTNAAVVNNVVAADFDWIRFGNSTVPGPTATPTSTATATSTGTPQNTSTPTATATATATATSTATATAIPTATEIPTATPTPKPKPAKFGFKYVSVWYHYIRIGTVEHVQIQSKTHGKHGIWTAIRFATGRTIRFYAETDSTGFWQADFRVPGDTISKYSSEAVVTFQLWKGTHTTKTYTTFFVVR